MSNRQSNATELNPRHFAEDIPAKVAGQLATVIGQMLKCTSIIIHPNIVVCSIRGKYLEIHIMPKGEPINTKTLGRAQSVGLSGGVCIISDNFDDVIKKASQHFTP